jgi:hypothetical protein
VYSRIINGEENSFGVSGKLIRNVLVMYDRSTGSLWSQLLGEAVEGKLLGTKLTYVPSQMTTWADWKAQHPDTLALVKGGARRDPYTSYYQSGAAGVIGQTYQDDRLYVKQFVIGVEDSGEAIAFPFAELNDEPLVNYQVGSLDVLVVFDAETGAGLVYDRKVEGRSLTFAPLTDQMIVDNETNTSWDVQTGRALEGPLAGSTLSRVKSTSSFWFGWKDFFPETAVYGLSDAE